MDDYEAQAEAFCQKFGVTIKAAFKGDRCPTWAGDGDANKCASCSCGATHGDRYRVTLRWLANCPKNQCRLPKSLTFDFWGSANDMQTGKAPTACDVLACISGDIDCPHTFGEFCGEYGYDQDSRKALALFQRCAAFSERLRAFFPNDDERVALAEIQ